MKFLINLTCMNTRKIIISKDSKEIVVINFGTKNESLVKDLFSLPGSFGVNKHFKETFNRNCGTQISRLGRVGNVMEIVKNRCRGKKE